MLNLFLSIKLSVSFMFLISKFATSVRISSSELCFSNRGKNSLLVSRFFNAFAIVSFNWLKPLYPTLCANLTIDAALAPVDSDAY